MDPPIPPPKATLLETPANQPSSTQTAALSRVHTVTVSEADANLAKLSDVVAALDAHEAQDADHRRRADQAALQARQRFD